MPIRSAKELGPHGVPSARWDTLREPCALHVADGAVGAARRPMKAVSAAPAVPSRSNSRGEREFTDGGHTDTTKGCARNPWQQLRPQAPPSRQTRNTHGLAAVAHWSRAALGHAAVGSADTATAATAAARSSSRCGQLSGGSNMRPEHAKGRRQDGESRERCWRRRSVATGGGPARHLGWSCTRTSLRCSQVRRNARLHRG